MSDSGKIIGLAAGGTGGHMFPAQSLAEEMKKRGWKVILFTDARGMRYTDKFPADKIVQLKAANPNIAGISGKISAGLSLLKGTRMAMREIKLAKPSLIVGFGGYPSVPTTMAARLSKVPYGLHEQNAVLGRANRLMAKKAKFVAHAFSRLEKLPKSSARIVETGNPLRETIREMMGVIYPLPDHDDPINLLVFGGSQGAALFSQIVPAAIGLLPDSLRLRIKIVQQARAEEEAHVRSSYEVLGLDSDIAAFFGDMPNRFEKSHLVISRAGASTVTEIAAMGRPSILVPLGIAMDDHQTINADVLVAAGAAKRLPEAEFSAQSLAVLLEEILSRPARLAEMATKASSVAHKDAVQQLANLAEEFGHAA